MTGEIEMKSSFEQNGGTYSVADDYHIPNLNVLDEPKYQLGIWGQRRLDYLKHHRRVFYINLLTSGKLAEHLREIETAATERRELIIRQMAKAQNVDERLKAENQMLWVGRMNSIAACANEIIRIELIYD
jgi:hypothetical protein